MIRLARPWIGEEELGAASAVLRSGMLVQGAQVAAFEEDLASRCARKHAIAVGSGTAALELALAALEVRGDVLCPDLSWPSPAHAIVRSGARCVLVDVDEASWNATPEGLAAARTERTSAAIVIDQFGSPADHLAISKLGVPVITDAACAIGSTIGGRPSASFGTIACLSFHPRKLVTTGEGGACVTDDDALAERLRILRNHGQREAGVFVAAAGNQRLSEMAAAIGRAQLARLDAMIELRRAIAARYRAALPFATQRPHPEARANEQTLGLVLPATRMQRDAIALRMRELGVEAGRLSYALHRLPSLGVRPDEGFPNASRLDDCGLALPLHHELDDASVTTVIEALLRSAREVGVRA